jgi:hypothetical protein
MVFVYIRKTIYVIIGLILYSVANCQNTTSRLTIVGEGETLFFNFNSFEKYRSGISISTIAQVYFIDTTNVGTPTTATWILDVKANSGSIVGDYGNHLPLNTIEIEVVGDDAGATYNSPTILSNVDNIHLVENGAQTPGDFTTLTLTYKVGTTTSLLGEKADYYYVDIIYTLQPQ